MILSTLACTDAYIHTLRWLATARTLANLAKIDPLSLELDGFASPGPYFTRQIKTLGKASRTQADVKDIESGKKVGKSFGITHVRK